MIMILSITAMLDNRKVLLKGTKDSRRIDKETKFRGKFSPQNEISPEESSKGPESQQEEKQGLKKKLKS